MTINEDKQSFDERVVHEARRWIGTPYVHQASCLSVGADCLGLVRGVWRYLIGPEPETMPAYTSDWGEIKNDEMMLDAANRHFISQQKILFEPGVLLLFRWRNMAIAKHAGICTGADSFIHAYEKSGVVEARLAPSWKSRVVATFKFPNPNT